MHDTYNVCHSCAIVLTNGDDSHVHPYMLSNVLESVERMGHVAPVYADQDQALTFICDCCGGRAFGAMYSYQTISI